MAALVFTRHGTPMTASFAQIRRYLYVIAWVSAISVPAFAQDLPPELDTAQKAVDKATQADADQYAPDVIAKARNELLQAQRAAQGSWSDRRKAPDLAVRAQVDADLARARSEQEVAESRLKQRQSEVKQLQQSLGMGDSK